MSVKHLLVILTCVGLSLAFVGIAQDEATQAQKPPGEIELAALDDDFTYQGRLFDGGSPANGTYDFEFRLYDLSSGGSQIGVTDAANDVTVTDGLFQVDLDFATDTGTIITGDDLWLEISVRPGASSGLYTVLSPRQEILPVPYAFSLRPGARVVGSRSGWNAIYAYNTSTGIASYGIRGVSDATLGRGISGENTAGGYGVYGYSATGIALGAGGTGIIRSSADSTIKSSPQKMVQFSGSNVELRPDGTGNIEVRPLSSGTHYVYVPVDVPGQLFGTDVKLKSIRVCYDCDTSASYITETTATKINENGTFTNLIDNTTNRTSTSWSCYTLTDSSPNVLDAPIMVRLVLYFAGTGSSHDISIGAITLTLTEN